MASKMPQYVSEDEDNLIDQLITQKQSELASEEEIDDEFELRLDGDDKETDENKTKIRQKHRWESVANFESADAGIKVMQSEQWSKKYRNQTKHFSLLTIKPFVTSLTMTRTSMMMKIIRFGFMRPQST